MRIDLGEKFERDGKVYRNLVFQANADADNATIKAKAKQNTHAKLAIIPVELENPPSTDDFLQTARNQLDA